MNWALWKKGFADTWLLLALGSALLILFAWAFVWFTSQFQLGVWGTMLGALPGFMQTLIRIPVARLASPAGLISVLYVHPVTMLVCVGWAVGRGSDPITGEIGRGTMEHLLTLPVRRISVLLIPSVIAALGAAVLALALWAGTWLGISTVKAYAGLEIRQFLPGAVNLFAMIFCLTGITALFSSWDHNRWRAMAAAGGFFVLSYLVELVALVWKPLSWLEYLSFVSLFAPQRFIAVPEDAASLAWRYDGSLVGIGLLSYALASMVFALRDIPQPN